MAGKKQAPVKKTSNAGNQKRTYNTKNNTSNKKSTSQRSTGYSKQKTHNPEIEREIKLVIFSAIMLLLFLSNFGIIGTVGNFVSAIFFGIFGLLYYILPVYLFISIAFFVSNSSNRSAMIKLYLTIGFVILLGILAELTTGLVWENAADLSDLKFSELYDYGSVNRWGGGVLFGSISKFMVTWIGKTGTILTMILLFIILLIFFTEKTILKKMGIKSVQVYENAKIEAQNRKISREEYEMKKAQEKERTEEEQLLRMDKKVSGVVKDLSLATNDTGKKYEHQSQSETCDEMHEITINEPISENLNINRKPVLSDQVIKKLENLSGSESKRPDFDSTIPEPVFEGKLKSVEKNDEIHVISEKRSEIPIKEEPIAILKNDSMNQNNIVKKYQFPSLNLLSSAPQNGKNDPTKSLKETALRLQNTLNTFGVKVTITDISQGPSVTRYELQPEQGVKVSRIVNLQDDIKLNLAATDIRIEAPIPGKAAIGIEVPNVENTSVFLRELLESSEFKNFQSSIAFAVGKDIGGKIVVSDIAKMPHMLIAGATGSGKSVCINTLIMSILYKAHPDDVKMIMIDPKVVELSIYNGIPHLMIPVVTDPKKAAGALHWGVAEMTERYKKFADLNVRDLKGYNKKIETLSETDKLEHQKLPQIIIIVDELADLMMVAPGEVEESICRLAQLARAAGIHLIIATQRPSVDVITGLIKANMPSRVAFSVSSGVDSRTILDMNGAEKLLGKGDMLFYPQGFSKPARIQGAFVSDKEIADVVDFLKNQAIGNIYDDKIQETISNISRNTEQNMTASAHLNERDSYFTEAGRFFIDREKASIGMLQRVLKIGFNRAARIMDQLEEAGVVGAEEGTKPRKVLMSMEEFMEIIENEE